MYHAWLTAMHALGYDHEAVYLNSMHAHPTPQSRDRMYVVFWKKGNKKPDLAVRPQAYCHHCAKNTEAFQAWKKSDVKWGKYKQQYIFRCPSCNRAVEPYYYAAFNCIDWSIPGTRIADRKKPLSANTMKRIQYGIEKYWNVPQIITTRYSSGVDCRVRDATSDTLPTQPGDQSHAFLRIVQGFFKLLLQWLRYRQRHPRSCPYIFHPRSHQPGAGRRQAKDRRLLLPHAAAP